MNEKNVLIVLLLFFLGLAACFNNSDRGSDNSMNNAAEGKTENKSDEITIFLCGDVMTGRGIDQILPHPSDPVLYEPYMKNAKGYVKLAEDMNGNIDEPVGFYYIWGDALGVFNELKPDVKIINLETSVTKSDDYWKGKGINYRMSPENVDVLKTVGIDFASLANNHVLDWGYSGLGETIDTLDTAGIKHSGAGMDMESAWEPAILEANKFRVIVISLGSPDSGVPGVWEATEEKAGTAFISTYSEKYIKRIRELVSKSNASDDIVVVSIHWGSNWGYNIPDQHRGFAHSLIDEAGVDLIHGHSSHHPKGIEIYKGKAIIYGAGDFINDYEGIEGYEQFRDDLTLMYFVSFDPESKNFKKLRLIPMQIKKFKLNHATPGDSKWLFNTIKRESGKLDTDISHSTEGVFTIETE